MHPHMIQISGDPTQVQQADEIYLCRTLIGLQQSCNAVIFSNDKADILMSVILERRQQFEAIRYYQSLSTQEMAEFPNWITFINQTNIANDVLCPHRRAKLLHEYACIDHAPYGQLAQKHPQPTPCTKQQSRLPSAKDCSALHSKSCGMKSNLLRPHPTYQPKAKPG